ncbi:MAG TPA: branched-chain amino acid ABC transporter permease [Actinomycetales bacterium]|nr:branched-chain amino acid ABC transporter permease [Actinomycetales bacterium]
MIELLQSLSRGVGSGCAYALLALGFVVIYRSTKVISFAQPALMVAGAVLVSYLVGSVDFFLAVPLAVLAIAGLGLVIERVALRPMVGKPVFIIAIITLGLDIVIRVVVNAFIGLRVRQVGDPWGLKTIDVGGVLIQQRHLAAVVTTAVIVAGLFLFFRYSRIGLAMRAASIDQEAAQAQGISVGAVFALSWAIAGGLAAVAGTFVASGGGIDQSTWIIALKALPAIILGGLDSVGGAVVGGIVVGLAEALFGSYQNDYAPWLGTNFSLVSAYVLMLLVLLVRPYGLWGTREVERV